MNVDYELGGKNADFSRPVLKKYNPYSFRTHPARAAGAVPLAQAAAWSERCSAAQFHGSSLVILVAG
jgi:hypothetical protein